MDTFSQFLPLIIVSSPLALGNAYLAQRPFENAAIAGRSDADVRATLAIQMIVMTRDFMEARSLPHASIAELLDAYRRATKIQSSSSLAGDYKTGNPQADIIAAVYRELRSRGSDAQDALLDLLDDEDSGVRGSAAAHALEIAPEKGFPYLKRLPNQSRGRLTQMPR